jgi:hypothetical protein
MIPVVGTDHGKLGAGVVRRYIVPSWPESTVPGLPTSVPHEVAIGPRVGHYVGRIDVSIGELLGDICGRVGGYGNRTAGRANTRRRVGSRTTAIASLRRGQRSHWASNSDRGHRKGDSRYPAPATRWFLAVVWQSPASFKGEAGTRVRAIAVDPSEIVTGTVCAPSHPTERVELTGTGSQPIRGQSSREATVLDNRVGGGVADDPSVGEAERVLPRSNAPRPNRSAPCELPPFQDLYGGVYQVPVDVNNRRKIAPSAWRWVAPERE